MVRKRLQIQIILLDDDDDDDENLERLVKRKLVRNVPVVH